VKEEAHVSNPKPRPALQRVLQQISELHNFWYPHRLRVWDQEGLTILQLRLLLLADENDGISNAELAQRLYLSRPSVSALLDRLDRGGFIRRDISPNDRRGICVHLEERGRRAARVLAEEGVRYNAALLGDISDREAEAAAAALELLATVGREARLNQLANEAETPVGA
jgi:DNA-binding MarR family transcriptional regulator